MNYALLHFGVALLLALLAFSVGRKGRRSEASHLLWVLVLIKLLVPPFLEVPILAPRASEPAAPFAPVETERVLPADGILLDLDPLPWSPPPAPTGPDAATVLMGIWIAGGVSLLGLYAFSIARFRRLLRHARPPAQGLVQEVRAAARSLGLAQPPRVRLVSAKISPALWPSRPATLVLPEQLLGQLTREERRHVLLHELAHFKHKDHWVRVLEAASLLVYWWLPPVYWIRRRLRLAEETCCDARVLRAGGDGPTYANALIRTVEFLQGTPTKLPSLATGALAGNALAQRITMIMLTRPARNERALGRRVLAIGLLAVLPLLPTSARATTPPPPAPESEALATSVPDPTPAPEDDEPSLSGDEAQILQDALDLVSSGNLSGARTLLDSSRGPTTTAMFDFTAGNLAQQSGQLELARRDYGIAVEKHPKFRRAWRNLGIVHDQLGDPRSAANAYRQTIELGGGSATNYGLLAVCLRRTGDLASAESAYLWAIVLEPKTLDWRLGLLQVLFEQERYADALLLTDQLMALHPERSDLHQLSIQAQLALGQTDRAREGLGQWIESHYQDTVDSGNAELAAKMLANRGDLELNAGKYELAVEAYRMALATDPKTEPTRVLRAAQFLAANGEFEHARTLQDLLETTIPPSEVQGTPMDPRNTRILISITEGGAVVYQGQDIGILGIRPLVERLLEDRELPVVLLADRATSSGLLVQAIDEAKLAGAKNVSIASHNEDSESKDVGVPTELSHLRARIEAASGETRELERMLEMNPENGEALLLLGQARLRSGEVEAALHHFERAAQIEGFEADARLRQAQALVQSKRYEEAVAQLRRSLALEPRENVADYLRAVERTLGRTSEDSDPIADVAELDVRPRVVHQPSPP